MSQIFAIILCSAQEHQIVKWRFENDGRDYLPHRWLLRMEGIEASMIMAESIEGVWLPREIRAGETVSTASFQLAVVYSREFSDYGRTEAGARVVFGRPKKR